MITRKLLNAQEVELKVLGVLDAASVDAFRSALNAELDFGKRTVQLDLEDVGAINSTAIGILVFAHRKAQEHGQHLRISRCNGNLLKMFHMIHLERIIDLPRKASNVGHGKPSR